MTGNQRVRRTRWSAGVLVVAGLATIGSTLLVTSGDDSPTTAGQTSSAGRTSSADLPISESDLVASQPDAPGGPGAADLSGVTASPVPQQTPTTSVEPAVRPGPPTELRLPTLGVRAPVLPIGQDGSLTLVPPDDIGTLGWWASGPEPGSLTGTSILTGHSLSTGGAALNDLEDIQLGDRMVVMKPSGALVYDVTSVKMYRKGTVAQSAAQIFDQSVDGRLAIVTCEEWNGYMHLSNLVVIAENPRPATSTQG